MRWRLTPLGPLFFRGMDPMDAGETSAVRSAFPPTPQTMQGFVRSTIIASHMRNPAHYKSGCDTCTPSSACPLPGILGQPGTEDPQDLRLSGPWLAYQPTAGQAARRLYRLPADVRVTTQPSPTNTDTVYQRDLRPAAPLSGLNWYEPVSIEQAVRCDLGRVRLPARVTIPTRAAGDADATEKPKEVEENVWVSEEVFHRYLRGASRLWTGEPAGVYHEHELWRHEDRVGIERDKQTRAAKNERLYQIAPVRLRAGVTLTMDLRYDGSVDGLTQEAWRQVEANAATGVRRIGGEGHVVRVTPESPKDDRKMYVDDIAKALKGQRRFRLILLQPAAFARPGRDEGSWLPAGFTPITEEHDGHAVTCWRGGLPLDAKGATLSCTLISACLTKPMWIGGWDLARQLPRPARPYAGAGSVYFFETAEPLRPEQARDLLRHGVGLRQASGFGEIALGLWPDATRATH